MKNNQLKIKINNSNVKYMKTLSAIRNIEFITVFFLLRTTDRIFNYLELEPTPVKTGLIRMISNHLPDFIENYNELKSSLNGTPFSKYLQYEQKNI